MARRNRTTSVHVLDKLVQQKEQPFKNFRQTSEEFLRICKIKGLSPDTIKFYDKELFSRYLFSYHKRRNSPEIVESIINLVLTFSQHF